MGRKKTRAKRRDAVRSDDDDEDEVVTEAGKAERDSEEKSNDQESVPNLIGASGAGMEEESDPEIEGLEEGFEEVENIVNAVMQMDSKEKEDINEEERISGGSEDGANFCEDGADGGNKDGTEVKNMNPNEEFSAEKKDSGANCLNSPSDSAGVSGKELYGVTEDNLMNTKEENYVEGEPSAAELQKIISDEPLYDVVEVEVSKEGKDDSEHNNSNDIVKENSNVALEKESKEGRDDSEHNDNTDIVEVNKVPSSDVILGRAGSVEAAATKVYQCERVLLQVKTVCLQRLPKSWDVEKITETCKQYGMIKRVEVFRNFNKKGNDVGFVAFATRESAVACVEGINKAQFKEAKVKADIMRPLVGGMVRKDTCKGFEAIEVLKSAPGLNINCHPRIEVAQKDDTLSGQIAINKSEMAEEMKMENAETDTQVYSNKKNTEGGRNRLESGVLKAHDDGMPSKSERKGRGTRGRRGKRGGRQDYNQRPSNKQSGNLQVHPRDSLRSSRRKSHFKRKPAHSAGSGAYRMPYAEKHAASSSSRSGYTGNDISRSKRPATYMEPHAGYLEPLRKKDRNHTRNVEPSLRHHEQIHSTYLEPPFQHRVPQAHYLQPVQAKDSLPHAGLIEFGSKRSFGVDEYRERRTGAYNGIGEQESAYWGVNTFPPTYAPNYSNYSSYECTSSGNGYHPNTEAYYQPTRPRY